VSDGSPVQVLTGHADGVYGVQFSPDGEWLVTASEDKTAVLWK
jgi:WD40 repeat protein